MVGHISDEEYQIILENSIISAVDAVIYNDKGQIFLAKRTQEPCKGMWWIPGGRQNKGEMPEEAVIRKIKGETGLDIEVERMIHTDDVIFDETPFPNVKTGVHYVARVYLARLKDSSQKVALDQTQKEYFWADKEWFEENKKTLHPYMLRSLLSSGVFDLYCKRGF